MDPGFSNANLEQGQCSNRFDVIVDLEEKTPAPKELQVSALEVHRAPVPKAILGSSQKGLDKAIVSLLPFDTNISNDIAGKQNKRADEKLNQQDEKVEEMDVLVESNQTDHIEQGVKTHRKKNKGAVDKLNERAEKINDVEVLGESNQASHIVQDVESHGKNDAKKKIKAKEPEYSSSEEAQTQAKGEAKKKKIKNEKEVEYSSTEKAQNAKGEASIKRKGRREREKLKNELPAVDPRRVKRSISVPRDVCYINLIRVLNDYHNLEREGIAATPQTSYNGGFHKEESC